MDMEKIIKGLHQHCECSLFDRCGECPYYEFSDEQFSCRDRLLEDALIMLKKQEAVVKQWTKEIADNQLANAPMDSPMSLDEQLECEYKRGIWDGLEIAWNIISESR